MPVAQLLAAGPAPGTPRTYVLGDDHDTELLCGAYAFDGGLWPAMLAALPAVTVVASAGNRPLSTLLALLAEESAALSPASRRSWTGSSTCSSSRRCALTGQRRRPRLVPRTQRPGGRPSAQCPA